MKNSIILICFIVIIYILVGNIVAPKYLYKTICINADGSASTCTNPQIRHILLWPKLILSENHF